MTEQQIRDMLAACPVGASFRIEFEGYEKDGQQFGPFVYTYRKTNSVPGGMIHNLASLHWGRDCTLVRLKDDGTESGWTGTNVVGDDAALVISQGRTVTVTLLDEVKR